MITIRIRSVLWFAIGAVVSIALVWSFMAWRAFAVGESDPSTVVSVTPARVLDTRDPTNLGLAGPFVTKVSQKLQITGAIPKLGGGTQTVVPVGATGVLLNVTVTSPTAAGFLSIRPGDATGAPSTSSLNFGAGQTVPNSVQVSLPVSGPNAGQIDITYDAQGAPGQTEVLIDVVGYTAANVYTKAQIDNSNANAFVAGGLVGSTGSLSSSFSSFGTVVPSKSSTGQYGLKIPGYNPGCLGPAPTVVLTPISSGQTITGASVSTTCASGDATIFVTASSTTSPFAAVDGGFTFLIMRKPGNPPLATATSQYTTCVVDASGEQTCT